MGRHGESNAVKLQPQPLYTRFAHLIANIYYKCTGLAFIDLYQREHGVAEIRGAVIRDPAFIAYCCYNVFGVDISQGDPAPRLDEEQVRLFEELMPSSLCSHTKGLFRNVPVVIEPLVPSHRVVVP